LSFTKAAEELRVSQSAISQQVRKLESRLGVRVFLRGSTGLELTGEGRTYLAILSEALDRVDAATAEIFGSPARTVLTVGAMATLALKWLLPRLPRFRRDHPDVQVTSPARPMSPITTKSASGAAWARTSTWPFITARGRGPACARGG